MFADAIDTVQAVNLAFDALINEVDAGKIRIYVADVLVDLLQLFQSCLFALRREEFSLAAAFPLFVYIGYLSLPALIAFDDCRAFELHWFHLYHQSLIAP